MRKWPPVVQAIFLTMAVRKEVFAIKIFYWGLAEGPVACCWFFFAFTSCERRPSYLFVTR